MASYMGACRAHLAPAAPVRQHQGDERREGRRRRAAALSCRLCGPPRRLRLRARQRRRLLLQLLQEGQVLRVCTRASTRCDFQENPSLC